MKTALSLRGIVKRYGRRTALDGLTLTVPAGTVFGLVGSNGAGKTTTLALCTGLLRHEQGDIDILEAGPFSSATHAGRLTLLPQDAQLPPLERVATLLKFYGRLQGLTGTSLGLSVEHVLEQTNLHDRRNSTVRELSHGMQRRLNIAQALLGDPDCVLLDEPLSGLDPREQTRVREIIHRKPRHQTIVISSHQLADIESLCTAAAFIDEGRCLRQDTIDNLTGRRHSLTYILATAAGVHINSLQAAMSAEGLGLLAVAEGLRVDFPENLHPGEINRLVIPELWRRELTLLAIRRGVSLETTYLELASKPSTPL